MHVYLLVGLCFLYDAYLRYLVSEKKIFNFVKCLGE